LKTIRDFLRGFSSLRNRPSHKLAIIHTILDPKSSKRKISNPKPGQYLTRKKKLHSLCVFKKMRETNAEEEYLLRELKKMTINNASYYQ
jgi:hypothetical protein